MARIFNDNQGSQSFHYIKIVGGKFRENAEPHAENAEVRTDKNGNKKWEIAFPALQGYITNIEFVDSNFGENAEITFEDGAEKNLLQISSKSYLFRNFIKRLPLLDPKKQTKLSVWKPKDNDFAQIATFQLSEETGKFESVTNFFKEDSNLPEGLEIPGEAYKNYHAQLKYLKEKAVDVFMKNLGDWTPTFEVAPPAAKDIPAPVQKDEPKSTNSDDDDLPF